MQLEIFFGIERIEGAEVPAGAYVFAKFWRLFTQKFRELGIPHEMDHVPAQST